MDVLCVLTVDMPVEISKPHIKSNVMIYFDGDFVHFRNNLTILAQRNKIERFRVYVAS